MTSTNHSGRAVAHVAAFLMIVAAASCGDAGGAAPPPVDAAYEFMNPLVQTEANEWAAYELVDGTIMTFTLLAQHPLSREVSVREEARDPKINKLLSSSVRSYQPNHFLWGYESAGMIVTLIHADRIKVAGRTWDCLCVEVGGKVGHVKTWFTPEVPVFGMLLQKRYKGNEEPSVLARLTDWSSKSSNSSK